MRIAMIVFALVATLLGHVARAQPAQERLHESVRRELTDKLQASGKFSSIAVTNRTTLKAKTLEGADVSISIDNLAGAISAAPERRSDLVARFVRSIVASLEPKPKTVTKDQFVASLRLVVRHSDYVKEIGTLRDGSKTAADPLWQPLAGAATIFVAIDYGERLEIATKGAGTPHAIADDDLFGLGREQLRRFAADFETEDVAGVRSFMASDDTYSPSLLLIDEPWGKVEKDLGAGFVVAIPDRNTLLAAPARQAAALRRAVALVAAERKAPPLIPELLQRSGAGWAVFTGR